MRRLYLPLLLLFVAVSSHAAEPAEGRWTGAIELASGPLETVVKLEMRNNHWRGSLDFPSQEAIDLPLQRIDITSAGKANFEIAHIPQGARFEGTLDGDTITGTYTQAGETFPFKLTRAVETLAKE
jgi:uncharacterized protein